MATRKIRYHYRFYRRGFPTNTMNEQVSRERIDQSHGHLCLGRPYTSESPSRVQPDQFRILIVDDDPDHREILKTQLDHMGFECCQADNGLRGIAGLKQQPVDLIISDYQMPEMGGLRMIQEIRSGMNHTRIPIIFMTGNPDANIIQKALLTGANAALEKPYSFGTLRSTIRQLTGRPHGHEPSPESGNFSDSQS